jgi:hypothetical protein
VACIILRPIQIGNAYTFSDTSEVEVTGGSTESLDRLGVGGNARVDPVVVRKRRHEGKSARAQFVDHAVEVARRRRAARPENTRIRYRSPGMMASLGDRQGLADLGPRILLAGMPAWFLWRGYYLSRLPAAVRKIRVALDWTLALFFRGDITSI